MDTHLHSLYKFFVKYGISLLCFIASFEISRFVEEPGQTLSRNFIITLARAHNSTEEFNITDTFETQGNAYQKLSSLSSAPASLLNKVEMGVEFVVSKIFVYIERSALNFGECFADQFYIHNCASY